MISDESFRKKEHLLKSIDFRKVYKAGRPVKRDALILYSLPNSLGHNRLGISISSNNVRLAYLRNRIRRILREIYRRNKKDLKKGLDIVFVVKKGFDKKTAYKDIEKIFGYLAKKGDIVC